jgi:hypothetical protein
MQIRFLCIFMAGLLMLAAPACAQNDPRSIGTYGGWNASYFLDAGSKVCMMSLSPAAQTGKFKQRGSVFLFITHWPADKSKNVVSVSNGYRFQKGSTATLKVGGKSFKLITQNTTALTQNQEMDDTITQALQKSASLTIEGISARGTKTIDTYRLQGSSAAYQAITKECGI